MIEIFSKDVAFKIKALGVYQVVFGLIGLGLTLWLMTEAVSYSILWVLLFIIPIALYAYSIYCGILLFQKHHGALKLSSINQYFQLINFSILGYALKYAAGPVATLGIDLTHGYMFTFNFDAISMWNMQIATQSNDIIINFNLVAFALIIFIDKLKKKIVREQDMQVLSIGEDVAGVETRP